METALHTVPANQAAPIAYPPKEAARLIGVGLTKLYELIGTGELPAKKAGGRTLITAAALHTYIARLPAAEIKTGQPVPAGQAPRRRGYQRTVA